MFHYASEPLLIKDSIHSRVFQPGNTVKSRGKLLYHKGLRTNQAIQFRVWGASLPNLLHNMIFKFPTLDLQNLNFIENTIFFSSVVEVL